MEKNHPNGQAMMSVHRKRINKNVQDFHNILFYLLEKTRATSSSN